MTQTRLHKQLIHDIQCVRLRNEKWMVIHCSIYEWRVSKLFGFAVNTLIACSFVRIYFIRRYFALLVLGILYEPPPRKPSVISIDSCREAIFLFNISCFICVELVWTREMSSSTVPVMHLVWMLYKAWKNTKSNTFISNEFGDWLELRTLKPS